MQFINKQLYYYRDSEQNEVVKVSKNNLTSKHTLQLLMYWIMGRHSKQSVFNSIEKIGVYNPRKNVVYLYDMNKLNYDVIEFVEKNIICYKK